MPRKKVNAFLITEDLIDEAVLAMAEQKPMTVRQSVKFIMEFTLKKFEPRKYPLTSKD